MKYLFILSISFLLACNEQIDEKTSKNEIPYVKIGTQIWMLKNLDIEHFRNGDIIPQVSDSVEWSSIKSPAWCYYNNDPLLGKIYGKLYNQYAVEDTRGLAPKGWKIPNEKDWETLEEYLGDSSKAGGALKSTGTVEQGNGLWFAPNVGATNISGFTALPGGYRFPDGMFFGTGYYGYWWAFTGKDTNNTWHRFLHYQGSYIHLLDYGPNAGLSVRCIKE
ncbi:hypothetical protein D9V86_08420 [Bacteroidetes/Chlorobi group bacterium ChocPot_Mid]|jgi:uncharacterized protein (TIGR02145 family)|nr:MAG: hypothetical protein D9V86_08420 [Bacteroidetes/Chlorobi group bacterium ChocPot_Mid]